jgi:hypothetical protein
MLRRSFWRPPCAAATLVAFVARPAAGQPAREKVRVAYEASPGCPAADVFLSQVRVRVGTDWEAPPDVLARTIDVRVSATEERSVARIDFVDEQGQRFTRTVSATTCDEVVSGIALITALAIESRVTEALEQSEPEQPDAAPPADAAPGPKAALPAVVAAPPKGRAPALPHRAHPAHWDIGDAGMVGSGVGPVLAAGLRGFVGLGWKGGPDFRLGVDSLRTPLVDRSGVPTRFSILGARASGCPLSMPLGAFVRLLPCAGAVVGAHRGEGVGLPQKVSPASAAPAFFTPFASLRAEVAWDAFFVEIEGEAKFPVDHHSFYFKTEPRTSAYDVPPVAFGLSGGVGIRL